MRDTVIPNIADLLARFRAAGIERLFARIACLHRGRPRPLPEPEEARLQLPPAAAHRLGSPDRARAGAAGDEITVLKTTDSALTGTNLRLLLRNLGIQHVVVCGIFTDQCISSTVRSLADESFDVVVVEDGCAAGTEELHERELEIINMIYCHVVSAAELKGIMGGAMARGQPIRLVVSRTRFFARAMWLWHGEVRGRVVKTYYRSYE